MAAWIEVSAVRVFAVTLPDLVEMLTDPPRLQRIEPSLAAGDIQVSRSDGEICVAYEARIIGFAHVGEFHTVSVTPNRVVAHGSLRRKGAGKAGSTQYLAVTAVGEDTEVDLRTRVSEPWVLRRIGPVQGFVRDALREHLERLIDRIPAGAG
jgi:carbon monoxide dehydrogenase subunit G